MRFPDNLKTISENVGNALSEVKVSLGFRPGNVLGYEGSPSFDPSTYASTFSYGAGHPDRARQRVPFRCSG